jgi:hypothetical protein
VAYGPRRDPASKASKEAMRERKSDVVARPVQKRIKVAGKKKADAPMAVAALKGTCTASSKAASMPSKATLKAGVPPCDRSNQRMRGLSPEIISGDPR